MNKSKEKIKAVQLRKKGLTYNEILKQVPVAKSTLSLWLRDVGLAKAQYQVLTAKRKKAQRLGAEARRAQRIERTEEIYRQSEMEIGKLSKRELWLMGAMLYWAEGAKEKEWNHGVGLDFANSDPHMIQLYLKWLFEILHVQVSDITCRIALHETHLFRLDEIRKYWLGITSMPKECFTKENVKRHSIPTIRKNIGEDYRGLLQVRVKKSSHLNRKIVGWTKGIANYYNFR